MKALIIRQIGNLNDIIDLVNIKKPIPKDNEVLVRMVKSSINPADILFAQNKYRHKPQLGQVAGFEGVGIVEDIGFNKNLVPGSLVAFRHSEVWAEYVSVPFEKLTILPSDFSIDKGAQFSLNPLTAKALISESGLQKGDWLVITAGASSVSKLIIQLSRDMGIKIISIVRGSKDECYLRSLGVDAILKTDSNVKEIIPTIVGQGRIQAVIDAVGGKQTSDLIKVISSNGRVLLFGVGSSDQVDFHNSDIIFKNLTISGFGIDNWTSQQSAEKLSEIKQHLIEQLQNDKLVMPVDSSWYIDDFKKAFERVYSKNLSGKVLLSF